jgi:hypothetical protein
MTIWFFLWLALSLTLLFFFSWTLLILFRQKISWKQYAEKRGLRYVSPSLMGPPRLDGVLSDRTISLFSSEHQRDDGRLSRKLTAIEITPEGSMPFAGGLASSGMVRILKAIDYRHEIKPSFARWPKEYMVATDNKAAMEAYLTEDRIKALLGLFSMPHVWGILAFRDDVFLLRLDMPQALDDFKQLDDVIKKMIAAIKLLELKPGEEKALKSIVVKEVEKAIILDDGAVEDATGLELDTAEE